MRSPLSEILDGAIGFTEPGYHAPRPRISYDEQQEREYVARATIEPEPVRKPEDTKKQRQRAKQNAGIRKELRDMLKRISSPDCPIPSREIWLRLNRKDIAAFRVDAILRSMVGHGITRAEAPYRDQWDRPVWLYWWDKSK